MSLAKREEAVERALLALALSRFAATRLRRAIRHDGIFEMLFYVSPQQHAAIRHVSSWHRHATIVFALQLALHATPCAPPGCFRDEMPNLERVCRCFSGYRGPREIEFSRHYTLMPSSKSCGEYHQLLGTDEVRRFYGPPNASTPTPVRRECR